MPFTLSHPAAILPIRRLAGRQLVFPALVIGSLTPDAGYFVNQLAFADFAHTPLGSVVACIPVGLLLYLFFLGLRRPVALMLPNPHRDAMLPLCREGWPGFVLVCGSIFFGALTHLLWDSFTHKTGWMVQHIPLLKVHLVSIGNYHLLVYRLLQHVSSIAGLCLLALAYHSWIRRASGSRPIFMASEWPRYLLWLGVAFLPALYVVYRSLRRGKEIVELVQPGMIFESVVMYVSTILLVIAVLGIWIWVRERIETNR